MRSTCKASCISITADSVYALQMKQQEQAEYLRRAERIRKLEARQKQEEEAAVKALSQQLLAHQVLATNNLPTMSST